MKRGIIYCYHINNKYYVGKTYDKERKRQNQHKYDAYHGTQTPFCYAIRKYGWKNILQTYEVLETIEDENLQTLNEKLIIRENYWIMNKNSLLPNGYNVHLSNHKKIAYIPNKKERYNKVSKKLKGKNNNPLISNKVLCVETNIVYPSVREAERKNNYPKNSLWSCLNGKQKTAQGYHWKYVDKETKEYDIAKARKKPLKGYNPQCVPIICLETQKEYISINDCARDMFGSINYKRGIKKSCDTGKPYHNYNFKFLNHGNPVPSLEKERSNDYLERE